MVLYQALSKTYTSLVAEPDTVIVLTIQHLKIWVSYYFPSFSKLSRQIHLECGSSTVTFHDFALNLVNLSRTTDFVEHNTEKPLQYSQEALKKNLHNKCTQCFPQKSRITQCSTHIIGSNLLLYAFFFCISFWKYGMFMHKLCCSTYSFSITINTIYQLSTG